MTTILCVRKGNEVVMAGDGQATLGESIVFKSKSVKVRRIGNGNGFFGFTLADNKAVKFGYDFAGAEYGHFNLPFL